MRFRLALNLSTLNERNAPLAEMNKNCGTHRKKFNEDSLMLSAAKYRPGAYFLEI